MKRVVAIDGPSGAGKSTVAKLVAGRLGFQYLDTGALYRAVALYLRHKGLDGASPDKEIARLLQGLGIAFKDGKPFINGKDVSDLIRTLEIGHYSSVFSARLPVREFLLEIQRRFPEEEDTVCEGRDMGTVVFPGAWKKFFLDASEEERARRRYLQLRSAGKEITMETALLDVRERDLRDSNRDVAPLRRADDAIYIDTTELGIDETVERIIPLI